MQYLKINDHYNSVLYLIIVLGTISSLVFVFFAKNWILAISLTLVADGVVLLIYKNIEGSEIKLIEINEYGVVTNKKNIAYNSIVNIRYNESVLNNNSTTRKLKYINIKTSDNVHKFDVTNCESKPIWQCLKSNFESYYYNVNKRKSI